VCENSERAVVVEDTQAGGDNGGEKTRSHAEVGGRSGAHRGAESMSDSKPEGETAVQDSVFGKTHVSRKVWTSSSFMRVINIAPIAYLDFARKKVRSETLCIFSKPPGYLHIFFPTESLPHFRVSLGSSSPRAGDGAFILMLIPVVFTSKLFFLTVDKRNDRSCIGRMGGKWSPLAALKDLAVPFLPDMAISVPLGDEVFSTTICL